MHDDPIAFLKRFPSLTDNEIPFLRMKEWKLACETLVASGITQAEFEAIGFQADDVVRHMFDAAWQHTCTKRHADFIRDHPSIAWVPRLTLEDRAGWPYVRRSEDDALSRIERWEELCLKIERDGMTPDAYSETLHEDHRYTQVRNAMRICYIDRALKQWPYVLATRILEKAKREEMTAIRMRLTKNRLGMTATEKEAEFATIDEEYKDHTLYNRLRAANPAWSPHQVITEIYVLRVLKEEEDKVKAEAKKRLEQPEFEKAVQAKMVELVGSKKLTPPGRK